MPLPEGLLAPISEERPGGTEVTYEADYSRVATLRDVRNPEHDFEEVVELATRMLQEESKDLTLAIWLTEAWMNLDGFEGLDSGLRLIHGLLDRFWDGLFPEEAEDRAFTLEFVAEGFTARDDKYEPIKFIPLTDWGHHLHHFEEWRGLRKDSFAGAEDAKKAKKKGDADDNPRAPTPENFESGFAETPKRRYKELRVQLAGCTEAATQLEALSKEHFTDPKGPRPSYGKLKDAISRATTAVQSLLDKKLELEPEPVEAPAGAPADAMEPGGGSPAGAAAAGAEEGGAPPAAPAAVRPAPVGLAPEPTDTEDAHRRVATAARYLRRADPTDPAPYLLLRGLRWGELRRGAGALDVRLLDAPPTEVRKRLKTSVLNAEWEALIEAAEEVMAATWGRGWLDLQRYVLTALDALGSAYRAASDAIKGELAALLRDVPGLLSATLMDDTPTANAETLEWLGLLGLAGEGKGDAAATGGAPDYDRERVLAEATHEKALEWAASGNPMRGVELLKKRAEREESERARFITESLAASVLVNAGMVTVARPMLEDLVDLVTKRNLGDWEAADVVARPVGLLYRCLPANDKRRNQLYDQLCRLDPVLAFSLQGADAGSGAAPATNPPPAKAESANEPAQPAPDGAPVDPGSAGG
jgi:type VI secretion system protein ImpA